MEMVRQLQPDLVISDVMMPVMSGKELCYKIKTNVELSHISVLLLTAQTSTEYMVEGFMFGADDYITKPLKNAKSPNGYNIILDKAIPDSVFTQNYLNTAK